MSASPGPGPGRARDEPVGITLIDLAALVAGAAIVAAIDVPFWFEFDRRLLNWLPYLEAAVQLLKAGCLALTPVILARRARYGGVARPAEFLTACCGLPMLMDGITNFATELWVSAHPNNPSAFLDWKQRWEWYWLCAIFGVSILAGFAFVAGRRRLPAWSLSALLMLAWDGLYSPGTLLIVNWGGSRLLRTLIDVRSAPLSTTFLLIYSSECAQDLLLAMPGLIALRGLRRREHPRRTWLEWVGLGLAAVLFLASESSQAIGRIALSIRSGDRDWMWECPVHVALIFVAIALGWPIARRLGPIWERWSGPGPIGPRAEDAPALL